MGDVIDLERIVEKKRYREAMEYIPDPNFCDLCDDPLSFPPVWTDGNAFLCEDCAKAMGNIPYRPKKRKE